MGRGLWVKTLALTMCQSLDLPSSPSVAEWQVLLGKACTHWAVRWQRWALYSDRTEQACPWGQVGAGVKQKGCFTELMRGHQFTQERGERPPWGRSGRNVEGLSPPQ